MYRIRRATQCSYQHKLLPKDQWTKPEDVRWTLLPDYTIWNSARYTCRAE